MRPVWLTTVCAISHSPIQLNLSILHPPTHPTIHPNLLDPPFLYQPTLLRNQTPKQVYTKPYITEADLHDPSLRTRVPALAALLEREDLTRALTTPDMPLAGMAVRVGCGCGRYTHFLIA